VSEVSDHIVDLVEALVAIPTHETEAEAQRLLATWLAACGFDCRLQEIGPGRVNLVARRGRGGPLVCSHVDVHPPHGHDRPFVCVRDGDVLVGRGVVDAKGQIAALVAACEAEPEAPVLVAITCDEERGGLGSERVELPPGPWSSDGGVVLEPTGFRVCTAQSGHIDVVVRAAGEPAHAYAPETSGSPISAVLAAIDALETCSFLGSRHPLLPAARLRVGRIDGGEHLWRKPAAAGAEIGLGLVPGTAADDAVAEVRARLDDLGRRWAARGVAFMYEIADASEAVEVLEDLPVVGRLAKALGTAIEPAGMPSWTDAGNLLVHHGIPCVVFGAGDLAPAHSDREWVEVDDLVRLCEVLRGLLRAYG
jgi:acetylornithine deacetylase/succinyl-diaminopimelate desuccinylase-like protein